MNKVDNGPTQRLLRTIGYALLFVSALIFAINEVNAINVQVITDFIKPVTDFLNNKDLKLLHDYKTVLFIVGLVLLLWTQTKSLFVKLLVTIIGAFTVIALNGQMGLLPFDTNFSFVQDLIDKSKWLPLGLLVFSLYPMYLILVYRKPKASSANLSSSGLLLIIIALVGYSLTSNLTTGIFHNNIYIAIVNWTEVAGLVVLTLGSLFGILALFRK